MINESYLRKEQIQHFIDEIKAYDSIRLEEIPEYRLYISQIEEFFDKKLGKGIGDDEERKIMSKTMIQNYIKDGLLMPPEGKSYNRNHMILLALIYNLKSILAIKDIKKVLSPILAVVDDEDNISSIEHIYNSYFGIKEMDLKEYPDLLIENMNTIEEKLNHDSMKETKWEKVPQLLLILTLIAQANIRKRLAEYLIETHFSNEDD